MIMLKCNLFLSIPVFLFQKEPQKGCFKQIYSLNNKQGFTEKFIQVL